MLLLRRWLHRLGEQPLLLEDHVQVYAKLLRRCTQDKSLAEGKRIHQQLASCDLLLGSTFLANVLVNMYGKCGRAAEARGVFDGIRERNRFSWSNMLAAYAQNGHCSEALQLYHLMDLEGCRPDSFIFASVLHACSLLGDASQGKEVHDRIAQCGFHIDTVARNSLLNMYTKCGRLQDARKLFDEMRSKDVVTWNIMLIAYAQHGHFQESLDMYQSMSSVQPDCVSHVSAISACSSLLDLEAGRSIHARIAASGCELSEFLQNALINLYGKCGSLGEARLVFDSMKYSRTAVSWNALIAACVQNGDVQEVLDLYHGMDLEGVAPSRVTFLSVVAACSKLANLAQVHHRILQTGFDADVAVATALVDSYAKSGSLAGAKKVFCCSPERNSSSWNAMIGACLLHGRSLEALQLFHEMDLEGVTPDQVTFTVVLGACSEQRSLKQGKAVHARVAGAGLSCTENLHNALINMYARCGRLEEARRAFEGMDDKSLGAWNSVIAGYVQNSRCREALDLYKMMRIHNAKPDTFTFASVLGACTTLCALDEGRAVHQDIEDSEIEQDDVVHAALVNMYGKCEDLESARLVFESRKATAAAISWNTLIAACVQCCEYREALHLFRRMDLEGIKHVSVTFVSILSACTSMGAASVGQRVYVRLVSSGLETDEIGAAVVTMYSKCGRLSNARAAFDTIKSKNAMCWTAMFGAYSHHVCAEEALELLCLMSLEGIQPNLVNFTSILNACSHGGLRDEGLASFGSMQFDYGLSCSVEQCICVSDMLARAGLLQEAEEWIGRLPFEMDAVAWKSLLNASNMHGNLEMATRVAKEVAKLQPSISAPYVAIANFAASIE